MPGTVPHDDLRVQLRAGDDVGLGPLQRVAHLELPVAAPAVRIVPLDGGGMLIDAITDCGETPVHVAVKGLGSFLSVRSDVFSVRSEALSCYRP
jgi:hypothetical protein